MSTSTYAGGKCPKCGGQMWLEVDSMKPREMVIYCIEQGDYRKVTKISEKKWKKKALIGKV